ncbi:MAG: hypothetical protein GX201_08615 [Clostridiales bacterium]|nr:hypothetical protein [Clostridiales bacterium]
MMQLMRRRCSIDSLFFILLMTGIIIIANITYADTAPQQNNQTAFVKEDIPSEWAKVDIEKAIEADLVPIKIQNNYISKITREEFSEIVVKLYEALVGQELVIEVESVFTDTQNEAVLKASNLGIVKGVGNGKFAPDNFITRQDISVMMYRTLKAAKPEFDYSNVSKHTFADHNNISPWAKEAVAYLYGIEVVNGVGQNLFNPWKNTSREEAIVLVMRMYNKAMISKDSIVVSRDGTSRRQLVTKLKLEELIAQEMGKPYQWGGTGPNSYDCSGLVYSIYGRLGISLPRTASSQSKVGVYVSKENLDYGDLVFFARNGKTVNHVGIYVGNGEFVHSPQTGDVVKKTTLLSGYYERTYYTARRVIN